MQLVKLLVLNDIVIKRGVAQSQTAVFPSDMRYITYCLMSLTDILCKSYSVDRRTPSGVCGQGTGDLDRRTAG